MKAELPGVVEPAGEDVVGDDPAEDADVTVNAIKVYVSFLGFSVF